MAGNWADALMGFSAGVQGKGLDFIEGLDRKKKEQQALSQERLKAAAEDARRARNLLRKNDYRGAIQLIDDRASRIQQLGGDPGDTLMLRDQLMSGDFQGVMNELDSIVNIAAGQRLIKDDPQDRFVEFKDGQMIYERPEGGGYATPAEGYTAPAKTPAVQVNVNDKAAAAGMTEEQKSLAKLRAKQLGQYQEDRDAALDLNDDLSMMEAIDVNTGSLEPAKQALAKFGRGFGIDTSGLANVSAGEGFNAIAQRVVLGVKASQKGPQTDQDENTIRATVANLGNTKAGNQFIMDSARALNNRKIARADFFEKYMEDNKGSLKGANRAWAKFKRDTPMVSSVMKTPQGLPVFYYKFEQAVRNANPDATQGEILRAWREANKRAK